MSEGPTMESDALEASGPDGQSPSVERERQYPMLEGGITLGTVCEYDADGWTWVVVTDLPEQPGHEYDGLDFETDEPLVRFLILDQLTDDKIDRFETAEGCQEHLEVAREYSDVDGAAGHYVPRSAFQEKFTARGPFHPDHDSAEETSQSTSEGSSDS